MFTTTVKPLLKSTLIAASALSLWACQDTDAFVRQGDVNKRTEITLVRLSHALKAEEDQTETLSAVRKAGLLRFVEDSGQRHGDVALIDAGSAVSVDRIEEVATYLKTLGLRYGGTGVYGTAPASTDMVVYIERYTTRVPECGNWAEESTVSHKKNQPTPNFGCATAKNLGLMVADPRDLVRGDKAKSSNTEAAVKAVNGKGSGGTKSTSPLPGGNK